jgi:hypothetical protein
MNTRKNGPRARYRLRTYLDLVKTLFRPNYILHFLARNLPGGADLRPFLHRLRGVKIYGGVWIGDDVYLDQDYPETVEIHDGAVIAARCTIVGHTRGAGKVIIGERAAIGAGCTIVCTAGKTLTIGEGAVVSAGATVLNDVPPFTLCGAPRVQMFGNVTVPFTLQTTYEEFRRGVQPLRPKTSPNPALELGRAEVPPVS